MLILLFIAIDDPLLVTEVENDQQQEVVVGMYRWLSTRKNINPLIGNVNIKQFGHWLKIDDDQMMTDLLANKCVNNAQE